MLLEMLRLLLAAAAGVVLGRALSLRGNRGEDDRRTQESGAESRDSDGWEEEAEDSWNRESRNREESRDTLRDVSRKEEEAGREPRNRESWNRESREREESMDALWNVSRKEEEVGREPRSRESWNRESRERDDRDTRSGARNSEVWTVGSPASGRIERAVRSQRRIVISPDGDRVYAPAGGKITKWFPLGNAMLFTTEFGAELLIQAGEGDDELLNRYFRPKAVQNEVVGKGKLLLEFDRQGLQKEGIPVEVSVSVKNCGYGSSVKRTGPDRVKAGEEILRICGPGAEG